MRKIPLPGPAEWLFSVRTFGAAILALYVGMAMDLDRPYWAMASAYIASQPLSGATRSKAVYRACGTVLGAIAAVALVPNFVDSPSLLSLLLALWVGFCLYFALLDRTPRSYVFMLAGYTAAIIGFPSVDTPDQIFTTALARVEEIGLGIGCASLMASLVFPRRVGPVLRTRLEAWLDNARRWSLAALAGAPEDEAMRAERRRLAGDVAEIDLLTSYLAWDPAAQPEAVRGLKALRRRMLTLLPVLSSLADRVRALRDAGAVSPALQHLLDDTSAWLTAGAEADPAIAARLRDAAAALDPPLASGASWTDMIAASLLERLLELVDLVADFRALRRHVDGRGPFPGVLAFHRIAGAADIRHHDHGRALWSAASAVLAIMVVCAWWIATEWPEGAVAAEMTAVVCCFFAAQDDPVPAIRQFLLWSVVAVVVDALYLFAALPVATNFEMLVLALAPAFLIYGALVPMPGLTGIGMALTANGATLLSLQSTYNATFDSFANSGLALVAGMGTGAVVTALVRSVGAEWSAWRLLRRGWIDIATAAERRGQGDRAVFAALMLDRLGLLAPRIATAGPGSGLGAVDMLADLRIGLNIVSIRRARRAMPDAERARIDAMLDALAAYFRARERRRAPPSEALLSCLDGALAAVTASAARGRARGALLGLVGIRRGLFPLAPAPVDVPPAPRLRAAA